MSVETSSAPEIFWFDPITGSFLRDPMESRTVAYVRRDLVVPTVDEEMVDAAAWIVARDVGYPYLSDVPDGEWQAIRSQAREMLAAVRSLLLSRIEGDNDADR